MRSPSPRRYNRSPQPRSSYGRQRSPSPRRRLHATRRSPPLPRRGSPARQRSSGESWRKPRSPNRRGLSPTRRDRSPHRARDKEWSGSRGAVIQEAESTVVDERRYRSSERHHAPRRQSPPDSRSYPNRASSTPRYKDHTPPPPTTYRPSPKLFDQTSTPLHERFSSLVKNQHPFAPKENISVGIERNVAGHDTAVIDAFDPEQIWISRRRGEGEVTLCQRDEFLGPQDDDHSERHVISVNIAADHPSHSREPHTSSIPKSLGKHENFKIQSREKVWQEDERRSQKTSHSRPDDRLVMDRRIRDSGSSKIIAPVISNPNDLRHNLERKRDGGTDIRQRIGGVRRGRDERIRDGGHDLSHQHTEHLPDFSQRPDKGKFEEWQNNPESIPKGTSYFEHDNRGDFDYWQRRGRGRGSRGWRGGYRGTSRGGYPSSGHQAGGYQTGGYQAGGYQAGGYQAGGYSRRDFRESFNSGDWKHDKYSETEGDPERPSSTT